MIVRFNDSMDAVRAFAGDDHERARSYRITSMSTS